MNKNIIILFLFMLTACSISAQVAIEKTSVDGSSILDFNAGTTKGFILPAVNVIPATPADTNGTFGLYTADGIVYMRQNSAWVPLTESNGNTNGLATLIPNTSAEVGGGVIMGAATSAAAGVLVLESSTLAFTLPKVNKPELNMKSPYPGTICYDTESNTLAVFDGQYWNYWKGTTTMKSTNGTGVVSSYDCHSGDVNYKTGNLAYGTAVSGVTKTVSAVVTTLGSYDIFAIANGVTYQGTGTFTSLGAQDIVLTASGRPVVGGNTVFTLNTNPTCSFTVFVNAPA